MINTRFRPIVKKISFCLMGTAFVWATILTSALADAAPGVEIMTYANGGGSGPDLPFAVGQSETFKGHSDGPNGFSDQGRCSVVRVASGAFRIHIHEVIQVHSSHKTYILDKTIPVFAGPWDQKRSGWITWGENFKTAAYTTGSMITY
jgi:hypothetical protein